MARIRATCPTCGDVELTVNQVEVRMCTSDDNGEYRFDCPMCDVTVCKTAESRTLDLLVASGVPAVTWSRPVEHVMDPQCPPISHDDLIDFHNWISDDERLAEAIGMLSAER